MLYRFRMVNGYETTHNIIDLENRLRKSDRFLIVYDETGCYKTRINLDNVVVIEALEAE